jgi:hypothetical protein
MSRKKKENKFILHACDVSSAVIPLILSMIGQSSKLSQTFSYGIHFPDNGHLKYS